MLHNEDRDVNGEKIGLLGRCWIEIGERASFLHLEKVNKASTLKPGGWWPVEDMGRLETWDLRTLNFIVIVWTGVFCSATLFPEQNPTSVPRAMCCPFLTEQKSIGGAITKRKIMRSHDRPGLKPVTRKQYMSM